MGREREQAQDEPSGDGEFESLLRQAAQVTCPLPLSRLAPEQCLIEGRLRIARQLGAGGMGVVFEAFDEGRNAKVALKALNRLSPAGIYRLKHEFRSLADVIHPNLCRLYELFCDADEWLFTMELVDGVAFDAWVRPEGVLHEARLRAALPQLYAAIAAIHAAGKLHRDLKPSNVLVTRDARVVVLDFGLVVDPELGSAGLTLPDLSVSGTPGYMSPEQAGGKPTTAQTDHYALGVMLFEALTGRLPFSGSVLSMLTDKQAEHAPRPSSRAPGVPQDLDDLCAALLVREPDLRMDGSALQNWFTPPSPRAPSRRRPAVMIDLAALQSRVSTEPAALAPERVMLRGRDAELAQLQAAFERACTQATPVVVLLSGESGIGKSTLCAAFLAQLRGAVVFSGRCFERERVPFKAFDVVVDALSRHLRKLGDDRHLVMPRDAQALHRIFPVLSRVGASIPAPPTAAHDAQALRRRGFSAFAELLGQLARRTPLVIHLDDLQWSDADSTHLLMHLLHAADAPPVLWILSHRSEQHHEHPHLSPLYRELPRAQRLVLGPLPQEAASALLSTSLTGLEDDVAGNPFLLGELSRHAARRTRQSTELSVRAMLVARVCALPPPERKLMEILAVASRPIELEIALDAAGVDLAPRTVFEALRDKNLARATGDGSRVECFHDKVREALLQTLPSERSHACHAALANALTKQPQVSAEQLSIHLLGAGFVQAAALQLVRAADAALRALSFDRAARMYAQALELGTFLPDQVRQIERALGDARSCGQPPRG